MIQMRITARSRPGHSNFKLGSSFEIGDLSFLARMRNCFPDPGRRTKPTTEVCLVYCAALNAAQR
jgi:hypothetical protein